MDFLASFHLSGVADKHDRLKDHNPLPRDRRIVFHEEKHEYWIDCVKAPRSVIGLVHTYGWEFDPPRGSPGDEEQRPLAGEARVFHDGLGNRDE